MCEAKGNRQPRRSTAHGLLKSLLPICGDFSCVKTLLTPTADCSALPSESLVFVIVCLSSACWCAVCIFNHNSNPLTFLQLNFQAPKPTLTLKPTRTRTGLSINLPRSWMPPALKLSGLLEQVSPSAVS